MNKPLYKIPLREFVVTQKGRKPKVITKKAFADSVPYLDISTLETNIITQYTSKNLSVIAGKKDLLVVWDGSRSGLTFRGKEGAIGSTLMCLSMVEITQDYLFYFLKSNFDLINNNTSGSGIPHVDSELFFELEVPYTNIEEQIIIVQDLENKLDQCSSFLLHQKNLTQSSLHATKIDFSYEKDDIKKSIDNFRKSVISKAVSGSLTEEWREKNPLPSLSIDILPDEISLVNDQQKNWHIPTSWGFTRTKNLVEQVQYGTSSKSSKQGTTPVLGMGNLQDGRVVFDKLKYSSDANDIIKYKLDFGDVLFNRTNSPELVGKTAVYESNNEAIFAGYLIRIKTNHLVSPKFFSYCLNSLFAKDYYKSVMVGSASQANINAEKLGDFLIPIVPLEEQEVIVERIERLLTIADETERHYESVVQDLDHLEKSILKQTFNIDLASDDSATDVDQILSIIASKRATLEESLKSNRNKIQHNNKQLAMKTKLRGSIIDVLEDSEEGSLTVEEVWRRSNYHDSWESDGYERFFKEIEENKTEIRETRSNNGLTITLSLVKNEN